VKRKPRQLISGAARLIFGDKRYSGMRRYVLQLRSNRRAFEKIYEHQLWGGGETVSGDGSTLESSESLRDTLPSLLEELGPETLLDAGCGDFNWMKTVNLNGVKYIGVDVVQAVITRNIELFASGSITFINADITKDPLPSTDLVLCRHCLIHLSNRQVSMALRNLKSTGAKYLLSTTFPLVTNNEDIWPGGFRPMNLEIHPFNLPKPLRTFRDSKATDRNAILALWRLSDIFL
jgi:SAM-dependent methyltransferase